jgi:Xaa-Pro aminopeptidase
VQIAKHGVLASVSEALRKGRRRAFVAYSPSQLTVGQMEGLQAASGKLVRWVKAPNAVETLRAVKDSGELAILAQAAKLISDVYRSVLRLIKPGITELALSAEIEFAMKERGATGASFETIVASGARSAWAHARPTSKPLRKNELVVLDQGAILRGYCSDMTRTVFLGRSSPRVRRMYGAVLEAQQAAKDAIRPGVKAESVDAAARLVLKRHGLAGKFTHSTGHGLGLEVHEMPRLGRGEATVLQQGMVLTVEPGVYVEGFGGVRIEDDIVVTSKGAQDLTTASTEFLEL